jgi:hypothetical protein
MGVDAASGYVYIKKKNERSWNDRTRTSRLSKTEQNKSILEPWQQTTCISFGLVGKRASVSL